jgi:hypothetical protein
MPGRIRQRLRVARDIGVAIQPRAFARSRIGANEGACRRVILARPIVIQPRCAIGPLPREGIAGWHRAPRPARLPIGSKQLGGHHARAGDDDGGAAARAG